MLLAFKPIEEDPPNMKLKSFLRPMGSGTRTKHLRTKCESHFGLPASSPLNWVLCVCEALMEGVDEYKEILANLSRFRVIVSCIIFSQRQLRRMLASPFSCLYCLDSTAVAYFVGDKLSRTQAVSICILYSVFVLISIFRIFNSSYCDEYN